MSEKNIPGKDQQIVRFGLNFRIQHIVLMLSTIMLIVSGLPLKFYTTRWAETAMNFMGGPEGARKIHHLAAVFLIAVGVYHLGFIIFTKTGRKDFKELIPEKKDFADFKNQILYFLGKLNTKPKFGRFSYIEKFDYWAVYWGFVIMIGSGIIMWMFQGHLDPLGFNKINLVFASGLIDNYVHAISREAHSDEAFLATMAIIIWHFYNVHFNPDKFPGSKVWITGKLSREEMEKEHPLELEEIEKRNIVKESKNAIEKKEKLVETANIKTEETGKSEIKESKADSETKVKNEESSEHKPKNNQT